MTATPASNVQHKKQAPRADVYSAVRNFVCRLIAIALISSGRVRRARKKAFAENTITAIYFHHPTKRLFAACIRWLMKHGYCFISARELEQFLNAAEPVPRGAVWLSFDDGCRELLDNVLPVAQQYGIPVTFFIPSGVIEGDGVFPWSRRDSTAQTGSRDALTLQELKRIASLDIITIGSHTVTHPLLTDCSIEELTRELSESKRSLESWARSEVVCFSYPYGGFDGRERKLLMQLGYRLAATTENAFVTREADAFLTPRFCVANEISLPEAICNIVGVWRPVIDLVKKICSPK